MMKLGNSNAVDAIQMFRASGETIESIYRKRKFRNPARTCDRDGNIIKLVFADESCIVCENGVWFAAVWDKKDLKWVPIGSEIKKQNNSFDF